MLLVGNSNASRSRDVARAALPFNAAAEPLMAVMSGGCKPSRDFGANCPPPLECTFVWTLDSGLPQYAAGACRYVRTDATITAFAPRPPPRPGPEIRNTNTLHTVRTYAPTPQSPSYIHIHISISSGHRPAATKKSFCAVCRERERELERERERRDRAPQRRDGPGRRARVARADPAAKPAPSQVLSKTQTPTPTQKVAAL